MEESKLADLRPLLEKFGPEPLFKEIGTICTEAASGENVASEDAALWECAAEAADNAAAALRDDPEDDEDGDEEQHDEEENESEADANAGASASPGQEPSAEETKATTAETPAPKPRREDAMKLKDRRIGPWPADTTHWRARLCDENGKHPRNGKLLSAFDEGIEVFEFPIKALSIEALCALGREVGDFWIVVEYYRLDDRGRMPRGRSRALHIVTPQALKKSKAEPSVSTSPIMLAPAVMPATSGVDASFAHMLSLLAFMQDRDEKARAAAREEARIAHDKYVADVELLKEREKLATQRQIAEMETKAKLEAQLIGRSGRGAAGLDRESLRDLLREELDERLGDLESIATPAPPMPSSPPDGFGRLADTLNNLVTAVVPLLVQNLAKPSGVANPALAALATTHGT